MVKFDIVIVTYNSEKWFPGFFEKLKEVDYSLSKLSFVFVDNASSDGTVKALKKYKSDLEGQLGGFQIVEQEKNLGFGKANNIGAKQAKSTKLFFLNVDTELHPETLSNLEKDVYIESSDEFVAWELRQWPYEHPKVYDPVTKETPWSSGAAVVIEKDIFESLNGFDDNIFMYGEDVDLSWRILGLGKKIKYIPSAVVTHYAYEAAGQIKPLQFYNSILIHFYLRLKFGGLKDVVKGKVMLLKLLKQPLPFKKAKYKIIGMFFSSIVLFVKALFWNVTHRSVIRKAKRGFFGIQFIDWDYSIRRKGDFYENTSLSNHPLVSVIIRSYNREPDAVRETLESLRSQTYTNFEVVIVEDGTKKVTPLIEEFSDLNIKYYPQEENKGRSFVGNLGMKMSSGEYLNFLDDDDLFYDDHLEVLVREVTKNKAVDAVYSRAFVTPITVESFSPYKYVTHDYRIDCDQKFNPLRLSKVNFIPIQTMLFKKELYLELGGFDESVEYLEDWDLWLRYCLNKHVIDVDKVTSVYRIPFEDSAVESRLEKFKESIDYLEKKHAQLILNRPLSDVKGYVEEMSNIVHVINPSTKHFFKILLKKIIKKILRPFGIT